MPLELESARKRAFAPKSKGGCRTCKLRRVKCDESKPACIRCINTGRLCEGYVVERTPARQTRPISILPKAALTTVVVGDLRDDYYLDFFSRDTAPKIAGFHDENFWTRVLVQVAHNEPAVRLALQAVVASHEIIERNEGAPVTQLKPDALRAYTYAVAYLRRSMTDRVYVNLTIIALFVCLEFIRGNEDQASIHIAGGLRMLANWQLRRSPSAMPSTPESNSTIMSASSSSTASEISLMDEMANVFSRLQVQTHVWGIPPPKKGRPKIFEDITSDNRFMALDQVRDEGFRLLSDAMAFISQSAPMSYSEDGADSATQATQQDTLERLAGWRRAYNSFTQRMSVTLNQDQLRSGMMVNALVICAHVWSSTCLSPYEEQFDNYEKDFNAVIELAAEIMDNPTEPGCNPFRHFQFDMGLIPALHLVGTRCRIPSIRLKAINILAKSHWREGLFDSWRSAQYIRTSTQLEESANQVLMGLKPEERGDVLPCEGARIHFATVKPGAGDDGILLISFYFKRWGAFGDWYVEQVPCAARPDSSEGTLVEIFDDGRFIQNTAYTMPHTHVDVVNDSSNGAFQHHLVNITASHKNPADADSVAALGHSREEILVGVEK